ncbi:MAG: hypothetical protein KC422_21715 [Trueperaceae bacterium]|nr:hypothetical protein [Trueperaceae bacterium]
MNILSDEQIKASLNWQQVLSALEDAFKQKANQPGFFKNPERVPISVPGGTYLTMPCADEEGWFGVKQVSVLPDNPGKGLPSIHAWYTLFEPSGKPALACNASLLTKFRTSAVSAVAAKHLAAVQAKTLLVIGTGALAPWMAEAHAQVRNYERILLWGRSQEKAQKVLESLAHLDAKLELASDLESAVKRADVISMATTARQPILKGEWLKPGQHVDLVGAFIPEMAEADAETIKRADIFVDDLKACEVEAGDLIQAEAQGWSWGLVYGDLAEVVSEQAGRQNPMRITLFKSVGLALEDLVVAKLLCQ